MEKTFEPLKILKQVENKLIDALSSEQLDLFLLLFVSAAKNNGEGKLKRETLENLTDISFNGEDLFILCRELKKLGCGKLTCCNQKNPRVFPCLEEGWETLPIGIEFFDWTKNRRKNAKS